MTQCQAAGAHAPPVCWARRVVPVALCRRVDQERAVGSSRSRRRRQRRR